MLVGLMSQIAIWLLPAKRILSWMFIIGIFVTFVRAWKGRPVVGPCADYFLVGLVTGLSLGDWVQNGLPLS